MGMNFIPRPLAIGMRFIPMDGGCLPHWDEALDESTGIIEAVSQILHLTYMGGEAPSITAIQNTQAPIRVFNNFNSKAKTIATFNFCKIKIDKLKVARFLLMVVATDLENPVLSDATDLNLLAMCHNLEVTVSL